MKKVKVKWRIVILVLLLLLVITIQHIPEATKFYAVTFYPFISWCLSYLSRFFPFSVGDAFITLMVASLLLAWVVRHYMNRRTRITKKRLFVLDLEILLWLYVWFYLSWGLNYSQSDFYTRSHVKPVSYSKALFQSFVTDYVHELNVAYVPMHEKRFATVHKEVLTAYRKMGSSMGMNPPGEDTPPAKRMLFPRFISSVGVTGYMDPFFAEYNLNPELLPVDYPFTYAHEFSHWLGITTESEANMYAYFACTRSRVRSMRYSGYYSILGYVLKNARAIYSPEEFKKLRQSIDPRIRYQYDVEYVYWRARYSSLIGGIQDILYDWYLRGNHIQNGQQNYSEVIGLILSCREDKKNIYLNKK
jgi:hypothetical protein